MKKILITGGSGFIARNISEQFGSDEYVVLSPNREELNLLDASKVFNYVKNDLFDVVIHTATYDAAPKHSKKDPAKVLENNLRMFFNVARCKDYFGKMIYFGSGAEFDREHWKPKMNEEYFDQYIPQDQYGFSKYIMTKYALSSENIYNLRLFGVFGKYDDWQTRFISNACCYAVLDQNIKINQNRLFDHIYIDDLIKILKWFIQEKPKYNVYNVCSGEVYDFKSLALKIVKISAKKLDIEILNTGAMSNEYSGDNSLLMSELENFQFTSIDEAIKALYLWYEKNKDNIDIRKLA